MMKERVYMILAVGDDKRKVIVCVCVSRTRNSRGWENVCVCSKYRQSGANDVRSGSSQASERQTAERAVEGGGRPAASAIGVSDREYVFFFIPLRQGRKEKGSEKCLVYSWDSFSLVSRIRSLRKSEMYGWRVGVKDGESSAGDGARRGEGLNMRFPSYCGNSQWSLNRRGRMNR